MLFKLGPINLSFMELCGGETMLTHGHAYATFMGSVIKWDHSAGKQLEDQGHFEASSKAVLDQFSHLPSSLGFKKWVLQTHGNKIAPSWYSSNDHAINIGEVVPFSIYYSASLSSPVLQWIWITVKNCCHIQFGRVTLWLRVPLARMWVVDPFYWRKDQSRPEGIMRVGMSAISGVDSSVANVCWSLAHISGSILHVSS